MPPKHNININIQNFDGNPSMVNFFFDQINEVKEIYNLSDTETFALFKSKLHGPALHFFLDTPNLSQIKDLSVLRKEFENFYVHKKSVHSSLKNLECLKIEPQESLRNFSYRLEKLLKEAYPKLDKPSLMSIKFTHFINAMSKPIKIKLLEENINDFDTALQRAEHLKNIYDSNLSPPKAVDNELLFNLTSDEKTKHKQITSQSKFKKFQSPPKNSNKAWTQRHDYSQRSQFHKYKQRSFFQKKNNYTRNNSRVRPQIQCPFCGLRNHLMKDCFQFLKVMNTMSNAQTHVAFPVNDNNMSSRSTTSAQAQSSATLEKQNLN